MTFNAKSLILKKKLEMVQSTLLQHPILSALRDDFEPLALVGAFDYFGIPFDSIILEFFETERGLS